MKRSMRCGLFLPDSLKHRLLCLTRSYPQLLCKKMSLKASTRLAWAMHKCPQQNCTVQWLACVTLAEKCYACQILLVLQYNMNTKSRMVLFLSQETPEQVVAEKRLDKDVGRNLLQLLGGTPLSRKDSVPCSAHGTENFSL